MRVLSLSLATITLSAFTKAQNDKCTPTQEDDTANPNRVGACSTVTSCYKSAAEQF